MRYFIAILAVCLYLPVAAGAQTPVPADMANNYFMNCMAQSDPRLGADAHEAFCACTAAQLTEHFTVEDMHTMSQETQEGRLALNRMLVNIYAPCMNYPVQEMVLAECMQNQALDQMGQARKSQVCGCTAETTGEWFRLSAGPLMNEVLNRNPNILDPLGPIMETPRFRQESANNLQHCLAAG